MSVRSSRALRCRARVVAGIGCGAAVAAGRGRGPPAPAWAASRPYGAQRGTEVDVQLHRRPPGRRPGDPVLRAGHHGHALGGRRRQRRQDQAGDRARLPAGHARHARPHGHRHQQPAARSASAPCRRSRKSSPTTTSPQPQKITLDTTVNGVVENEDVDYFVVEAKKGERITAEIEGMRLGNTFFDPYVAILDTNRFELARLATTRRWCGRTASPRSSPRRTAPTSSRSAKRPSAATGSCVYRLHVGRFPRPTAVLPAGGKPGETLDVQLAGRRGRRARPRRSRCPPTIAAALRHCSPRTTSGIAPSPNAVPPERPGQRHGGRAEQRRRPKATRLRRADGAERRDLAAGRHRLLQVRRQEGPGVRRSRAGPRHSLAARLGAEHLSRRRRGRRPATTTAAAPTATSASPRPRTITYVIHVQDHLEQGRRRLRLSRRSRRRSKPRLTMGLPERQPVRRHRDGRRAAGQPHGVPGQRQRGPISAAT